MVKQIEPEYRYYCPYTDTWFKNASSFCNDGETLCKYFKGTKNIYEQSFIIETILCSYGDKEK